jgi:hypothetical protein
MILKGSQRANGADLAIHLMNSFDNEAVEIAEVYGAAAGDLYGAFAEFEAASRGTKAKEYLYSLSINPSAPLTREQYHEAIAAIEHRLNLSDQPRAVVFHVKDGREHCHVVWSRIDIDNMRAIHMAHDRRKLMDLACELARKYGLDLPPGLKAWEENQKHEKERLEPTLGEKAQAEATGISPEHRREEITAAYEASDTADAFRSALEERGYLLARGDRRGFVVVDKFGGVHSLSRYINGHTAKQIKNRLAALGPEQLPSAEEAKASMRRRMQAQQERKREQQNESAIKQADQRRRQAQEDLSTKHAARRFEQTQKEQELLIRQQAERLALHAAQASESSGFLFRVRSAVADLIGRTPGLRSVLSHIVKLTHLDPKERHALERDALSRRHKRERLDVERGGRMQARLEARERAALERALKREERLQQQARTELEQSAGHTPEVREDFYYAARDQGFWKKEEFGEGDLREAFNDAAEFTEGEDADDEEEALAADWNAGADDDGDDEGPRGRKRRRGKGYGHRRDSD